MAEEVLYVEELEKEIDQEPADDSNLLHRVEVSEFDYSAGNFFSAMVEVEDLCGTSDGRSLEMADMEWFCSTITFLKEWKYFNYVMRTVSFVSEFESGEKKDLSPEIILSQFSAASVPQMEESPDAEGCLNRNDFIFNAGGLVWALDWCPQNHEKPDSGVHCEYLAVSAHAPGATCHKIGAPLVGRGLIQIWCILCASEKDFSLRRPIVNKNAVRKRPFSDVDYKEALETSRPKGRPKKYPLTEEGLHVGGVVATPIPKGRPKKESKSPNSLDNSSNRRPRGRPKKISMLADNLASSTSGENNLMLTAVNVSGLKDLSSKRSRGRPKKTILPLKKARGRPRKNHIQEVNSRHKEDISPSNEDRTLTIGIDVVPLQVDSTNSTLALPSLVAEDSKSEIIQPKRRGRPRKTPVPTLNPYIGNVTSNILTATEHCEKETMQLRCRGRPRKTPSAQACDTIAVKDAYVDEKEEFPQSTENQNLSIVDCVLPSSMNYGNNTLASPFSASANLTMTTSCNENIIDDGSTVLSSDLRTSYVETALPLEGGSTKRRGRPRKAPLPDLNESIRACDIISGKCIELREKDGIPRCGEDQRLRTSGCIQPSSADSGNLKEVTPCNENKILNIIPFDLPLDADSLSGALLTSDHCKEEVIKPRSRGRPRKKPMLKDSVAIDTVSGKDNSLKREGNLIQLSENQNLSHVNCFPPFNSDSESYPMAPLVSSEKEKEVTPLNRLELLNSGSGISPLHAGIGSSNVIATIHVNCFPPFNSDSESYPMAPLVSSEKEKEVTPLNRLELLNSGSGISPLHAGIGSSNVIATIHRKEEGAQPKSRRHAQLASNTISGKDDDLKHKENLSLQGKQTTPSPRRYRRRKNENLTNLKEDAQGCGTISAQDAPPLHNTSGHASFSSEEEISVPFTPLQKSNPKENMFTTDRFTDKRSSTAELCQSSIPEHLSLPRVVMCLAHMGKVAWDIKWRPLLANTVGKQHMGYLAVLLGNGSLEVWDVPLPSTVKALFNSDHSEGTDPRFIKLEPVFRGSKLKSGDSISIPLTMEWSCSLSRDLILAGCHDGMVALWKFSAQHPCQDTRPLLFFSADSVPIRALAWSPEESGDSNIFVTSGEGLKFWDLRDPFHPLWELNPVVQRSVLSIDWLRDPWCIIMSSDDGTLRTLDLSKALNDVPVTGELYFSKGSPGLHAFRGSSFAVWNVQVSRFTDLVACCTADGSAFLFQLTNKLIERDRKRYNLPHFLCGSFLEEDGVLKINSLSQNVALVNIYFPQKNILNASESLAQRKKSYMSAIAQITQANDQVTGSTDILTSPRMASQSTNNKTDSDCVTTLSLACIPNNGIQVKTEKGDKSPKYEVFPPKVVAVHSIKWNPNKGSHKWLCYGGAAGIIRCHEFS